MAVTVQMPPSQTDEAREALVAALARQDRAALRRAYDLIAANARMQIESRHSATGHLR